MIGGKCWNRLNYSSEVILAPASVQIQKIPELMTNFSLAVNKTDLKTNEALELLVIFLDGDQISCNVSYNGTGTTFQFDYQTLVSFQEVYSEGRKAYRLTLPANSLSKTLPINVTCRNVWHELEKSIVVSVSQVPIQGIAIEPGGFACFNLSTLVVTSLLQGAPVYKALFVDDLKRAESFTFNDTNSSFAVTSHMWGAPGWKQVSIYAWNDVSSTPNVTKTMRVADTITSLDVQMNFTLSSSQGLSDRPSLILPVSERVDFTALVSPNASGYLYNWTINGTAANLLTPDWFYTFPSTGIYRLNLVADGCNNVVYDKYLRIVASIADFSVSVQPFPEVVVNRTISIRISHAMQSECLHVDFGDGSLPMMHCKSYNSSSDLNCFSVNSVCQLGHVYQSRGNFTIKVTASNELYARSKEVLLVAKTCYYPTFSIEGNLLLIPIRSEFYACSVI